jgi:hypothetical protein
MKDFLKELNAFVKAIDNAADGELKRDMNNWLEGVGFQFLEEVRREIIRLQVVDTRRLLDSFIKGEDKNIWEIRKGGLALEVGSDVDYARAVNDGHFTIDPDLGKDRRWVPGYWDGDKFVYDRNAKDANGKPTGMLIKFTWIDGKEFFENALFIFEEMFGRSLERNLDGWIKRLAGGRT